MGSFRKFTMAKILHETFYVGTHAQKRKNGSFCLLLSLARFCEKSPTALSSTSKLDIVAMKSNKLSEVLVSSEFRYKINEHKSNINDLDYYSSTDLFVYCADPDQSQAVDKVQLVWTYTYTLDTAPNFKMKFNNTHYKNLDPRKIRTSSTA